MQRAAQLLRHVDVLNIKYMMVCDLQKKKKMLTTCKDADMDTHALKRTTAYICNCTIVCISLIFMYLWRSRSLSWCFSRSSLAHSPACKKAKKLNANSSPLPNTPCILPLWPRYTISQGIILNTYGYEI